VTTDAAHKIKSIRLLLGSGVVIGASRNQACDKGTEQGFAASASVVHKLEKAEVQGQLVFEMPRCGRNQERSSDQKHSRVLTCTSQKPSPSSSRAYSLRAWQTVLCP